MTLPARRPGLVRDRAAVAGAGRLAEAVELARNAGALLELAWAEETLAIALLLQGDPAAALQVLDAAIPAPVSFGSTSSGTC